MIRKVLVRFSTAKAFNWTIGLIFKETCHEMNIFLKALKITTVMVSTFLDCLFMKKIQNKVSACFYVITY